MDDRLNFGPFEVIASPEGFTLRKEGREIRLVPAEGERLRKLVGICWGMEDLQTLPSKIQNPPFTIFFTQEGCELSKEEEGTRIPFTFRDCDALIQSVDQAVQKSVDLMRLVKRDLPTPSTAPRDSDII